MSTITGSGTLSYNGSSFSYNTGTTTTVTFPITITNTSGSILTVTFGSNLTLTNTTDCLVISSSTTSGVTIDGGNYVVTIPTNYQGLVQNGTVSTSGKENCLVKNIGLESSGTIISGIAQDEFGTGTTMCSITNCYAIVGGDIFGGGGIAGNSNGGSITNCYAIVGGNINSCGGIAGLSNGGSITNCYAIVGGNIIGGGIAGQSNGAAITNCYAIVGGNILSGGFGAGGGIAGQFNGGAISSCYVNQGYGATVPANIFVGSGTAADANCSSGGTANWTPQGRGYLSPSSAWRSYQASTPYVLEAFKEQVTSSGTVSSASGSLGLTTYGATLANGTVTSTQGGTWTWSNTGIGYSGLSPASYPLYIYAFNLLSGLYGTSTNFFTNNTEILFAYNSGAASANTIVPYEYSTTSNVSITYAANVVCFLEGTEILTARGYVKIEELTKRDNVFTSKSGFQKIYKVGREKMTNVGIEERVKDQLYLCEKDTFNLTKDLILTGCHSILVDTITEEERKEIKRILGQICVTECKYRLPACLDKRTKAYPKGKYRIYHIALENKNELCNYGIYANGLLVESCCKYTMDKTFGNEVKNIESVDLRKMCFV